MLPTQTNRESLNSTKISVNANGKYSFEVKVYDIDENIAFAKACKLALQAEQVIREKNSE